MNYNKTAPGGAPPPPPDQSGISGVGKPRTEHYSQGFAKHSVAKQALKLLVYLPGLSLLILGFTHQSNPTTAETPKPHQTLEPRQTATRFALEYTDSSDYDSYRYLKYDLNDLFTESQINQGTTLSGGVNINRKRSLQLCDKSPTCVDGNSDREENYFDGHTRYSGGSKVNGKREGWGGVFRQNDGDLDPNVYVLKHPCRDSGLASALPCSSATSEVHFKVFTGTNFHTTYSTHVSQHRTGFKDQVPTVEPQKGTLNQLYVSWEDLERYQPNSQGLIETDSSGNITAARLTADQHYRGNGSLGQIYWQYRIYHTTNNSLPYSLPDDGCREDPSDNTSSHSLEKCWGSTGLGWAGTMEVPGCNLEYFDDNKPETEPNCDHTHRTYQASIDNLSNDYEPATELFVSMRLTQYRHGQRYETYSNPARIFLPAEMTLTSQARIINASWEDTYTDTIDHYQYRIGHNESGRQTEWTSGWITICDSELGEDTSGANTQTTAEITATQPHLSNDCGSDPDHSLQADTNYRVQIRAVDESRRENPNVRNYVQPNTIALSTDLPPEQPQGLQTTPIHNTVTLAWNTITSTADITGTQYRYKASDQPDTEYTEWTSTPMATDITVDITGLQPETQYTIQLKGISEHGDSPVASTMVTTEETPAAPSPTPSGGGGVIPFVPSGPAPPSGGGPTDEQPTPTDTGFTDTAESVHQTNIVQLADMGVTRGCNPPENSRFCPSRAVTRAEMATFLVRAFELPTTNEDPFTDTTGNVHSSNINRMAAAGISRGCNPPTNDRFCPDRAVTRAEMATFMTRVLQLEQEGTGFTDTAGNVHATNIRRFAEAGITRGCNPPANSRYCPERAVTRAEMATFLVRSTALNNS